MSLLGGCEAMEGRVLVYHYQYWDEETQWRRISAVYATEETIRNGLGVVLHHTGIEIDPALVHDTGVYDPFAEAKH